MTVRKYLSRWPSVSEFVRMLTIHSERAGGAYIRGGHARSHLA